MKTMTTANKKQSFTQYYLLLFFLSLGINALFLYNSYKAGQFCQGTLVEHGEVGYNIARHNSWKVNPDRVQAINLKQRTLCRAVEYSELDHTCYGAPSAHRDVGDTIGYGCVLGVLWKITGSYNYLDVQLLQILVFSLLMLLIFQIALLLFNNVTCAVICSVTHLLFFPLIFQNVQAHRDVWAYYGVVVLVYALLKFLRDTMSIGALVGWGLLFSFIQFVRPSVFWALITISAAALLACLSERHLFKKTVLAVLIFFTTNMLGFWVPFMAYNNHTYGRFFVGPIGQDLIEGIGEYPNPWGYQLDDDWFHDFMKKRYPELTTRQERDDQAKLLFKQAIREQPLFFAGVFAKRFAAHLLPNVPWSYYPEALYKGCVSFMDKLKLGLRSPRVGLDLLGRMLYVRLFLFLGYLGAGLLLARRRYFELLVLVGIIMGGFGKFVSHIEYRYLVPYYWPFAFFVGYLVWVLWVKARGIRGH